jgi:hypothetical protein
MPPDSEEFLHAVAKAVAALIIATEDGDRMAIIAATNRLFAVLTEHANAETRKAEALGRAIEHA